jgi:hypothetical protein
LNAGNWNGGRLDDGDLFEYDIFFTVSRSSQRGVLNLFVQSAYVRDQKHWNRPQLKPISFHFILFNALNGKPIHIPK